jgi:LacI family transcriptional regulator
LNKELVVPATLADIANKLDISPGLVSKVLNNRSVRVSADTKRRIQLTAKELNYAPSSFARALRNGKTNVVAISFIRPVSSYYMHLYSEVIGVIAEDLARMDYSLLVRAFADQQHALAGLRDMSNSRACDAFVLTGPWASVEEQACLLEQLAVPFIVIGRYDHSHSHWVQADYDHEGMALDAVEHLASLGHSRIAYAGFPIGEPWRKHIRDGYVSAMKHVIGSDPLPEWIAEVSDWHSDSPTEQVEKWLNLPEERRPTALLIGAKNDAWLGAELALARRGQKIGDEPGQFAVAGFAGGDLRLLFGKGHMFATVEQKELAVALVHELLLPLLQQTGPANPVLLMRPKLIPTKQLIIPNVSFNYQS